MFALLLAVPMAAQAVQPNEILPDPKLEARARDLSSGLRCLVCQNQSIDDSNAPLARDLRLIVRERLQAGDSDDEVMRYLVARYGDFILLKPPFKASTALLWAAPALVLLLGLGWLVASARRRRGAQAEPATPLSAEESARLAAALKDE
ncbi:MAG: cytochrome [Hyphomicrobiales bacterium]|jgi:cytochrome c-type biogenesis protein CcmH|nr:cytochrome [Hyphomicrobiales bacterium]